MHGRNPYIVFLSCLAFLVHTACSSPVDRPKLSKASSNARPGSTEPGSVVDPASPQIDTQQLRGLVEKIMAPTNPECDSGTAADPALPLLRLMTRNEYKNTIRDLLGLSKDYSANLPVELRAMSFKNNANLNMVSDVHLDAYMSAAKSIANDLIAGNLASLIGCPVTAGESCASTLIKNLAPKLWRRPISAEESTRMLNLFKSGASDGNEYGFQLLIRGILSSPNFLYRSELGKNGKLTAHEIASGLSYFFWSTAPDEELRKLADSGELLKEAILLAQAKRLFSSPKTKAGLKEFADAFLNYSKIQVVTKDAQKYPQFTQEIRNALNNEAEDSFDYFLRVKDLKFKDLYTAEYSAGSPVLAAYYGATPSQDNETQILNFSSQKRRGILGWGSVLASLASSEESHPIRRGTFVREHLLCEILPPTPPGLDIQPVPIVAGQSTRERFTAHTAGPSCVGCHLRINGVGFGMEDYDAIGLYRETDSGKAVDASGEMIDLDGKDLSFTGTDGLSAQLKDSDRAKRCFVLQAFRSAAGRFETNEDVCSIRSVADDFIQKDSSLSEVLLKVITNSSYLKRKGI